MIDAEVRLAAFESRLAQASDIEDCWAQLRAGTVEFGFKGVRMVIDGRVFEELLPLNSEQLWQLRIPLQEGHYINFFREFGSSHVILSAFATSVGRGLNGWLAAPEPPGTAPRAGSYSIAFHCSRWRQSRRKLTLRRWHGVPAFRSLDQD